MPAYSRRTDVCWCVEGEKPDIWYNPWDKVQSFKAGTTLEMLMVQSGAFKSFNQSRKNGYSGAVPWGWTEIRVNGKDIYIANQINPSWVDPGPPDPLNPER